MLSHFESLSLQWVGDRESGTRSGIFSLGKKRATFKIFNLERIVIFSFVLSKFKKR
jgi:hypothetical protein